MLVRQIFLIAILLLAYPGLSQDALKNPIVPLTPNAASLGKFGETPIGLYTGQPNITIPIYQIDYPGLSVPINLVYSYNGLKVEEYPGWVGTGWTLTGTGVINRQQRSLPDESPKGYNGQYKSGEKVHDFISTGMYQFTGPNFPNGTTPWATPEFQSWLASPANQNLVDYLTDVKNGFADSEPDMFVFNVPGYSGKFFFDHTQCETTVKSGVVLPHQNLQIKGYFNYSQSYPSSQSAGVIEKFEITDEKGNQFLFEQLEQSITERENVDNGQPENSGVANSWYLTSISDVFGNEILYEYLPRTIDSPPTLREELNMPYEPNAGLKQFYYTTTTEAVLKEISFRNGSIEFIEETSDRLDWNSTTWKPGTTSQQPRALANISVKSQGQTTKEFELHYGYFGSHARLRLDQIVERNGGTSKPPYEFIYRDISNFPRIGDLNSLFSQDHWGYYTAENIQTLLPPYRSTLWGGITIVRNGNSRTPNPNFASAGMLEKIIYPTGGFTTFEYEPNEYHSLFAEIPEDFNPCAGEFVSYGEVSELLRWDVHDENESVHSFSLDGDICSKVEVILDVSGCEESQAYVHLRSTMGEYFIKARMNTDRTVSYEEGLYRPFDTFVLPAGNYELVAGVLNAAIACPEPFRSNKAFISLSIVSQNPADANFTRVAGGMRISKVTDCATSPCSGCTTKYFDFSDVYDPSHTSGRLITGPNYIHKQRFSINNNYEVYNVDGDVVSASSNVPVVGTQGSTVGYRFVTIREESGDQKGKTVHHFTSANEYPDDGSLSYPFPPRIDNDWKRGAELTTSYYLSPESNGPLVSSKETNYQFQTVYDNQSKPIALKLGQRIVELDEAPGEKPLGSFIFFAYAIESGWKKRVQEKNTSFAEGQPLETITNFTYNNDVHLQPTAIQTIGSDGKQMLTVLRYKDDLVDIQNLSTEEVAGIEALPDHTIPIEEHVTKGLTSVSRKLNLYLGPQLDRVKQAIGNGPLEEKINISAYDQYGNILGFSTNTGEKKSYLYGYNHSYPIAEVVNAEHNQIYVNSFETSGTPSTLVMGMNHAKTGTKVHQGGNFIMDGFTPSNPSVLRMSYWYWDGLQWNFSGELPFSNTITSGATHLDEVRVYPVDAIMSTFTYDPGIGMTSKTDQNNVTTYYEYDALGRLQLIRDDQYNLVSGYDYYYKN